MAPAGASAAAGDEHPFGGAVRRRRAVRLGGEASMVGLGARQTPCQARSPILSQEHAYCSREQDTERSPTGKACLCEHHLRNGKCQEHRHGLECQS